MPLSPTARTLLGAVLLFGGCVVAGEWASSLRRDGAPATPPREAPAALPVVGTRPPPPPNPVVPPVAGEWRHARAGFIACDTRLWLERAEEIDASGDRTAAARLLADETHCTRLRGGLRVYVHATDRGLVAIRPEGMTGHVWARVASVTGADP